MVRRVTVVPYGRMQFLDVTAGPFERAFGLATVRLHTAAAASDARIPGLDRDEAGRLRDRLAAVGEAKAQGL
jgi:membrane protein YdbS with pleckstrin-like domain